MPYQNLIEELYEEVALIKFNRPDSLNAFNAATLDEFSYAVSNLCKNDRIKVIIVSGTGEKSFVAGADIKELETIQDPLQALTLARRVQNVFSEMKNSQKIFIAAVNGFALGGGLEVALACDFIYATDNSVFGCPEVGLGVIPGWGGTKNLINLVGINRAKEMVFTGKKIGAKEAYEWGIVNEVTTIDELIPKVIEVATTIANNSNIAVGLGKLALENSLNLPREAAFHQEALLFSMLFCSEDKAERMSSFLNKKKTKSN